MSEASTPRSQQSVEEVDASQSARPLELLADEDLMQITGMSESALRPPTPGI